MKIIFARTRHSYDSYADFWKLVELSKFDTCFVDEIDLAHENFYIVTPINGEFRPHIENVRTRMTSYETPQKGLLAWWNLERPDSGPGALHQLMGSMVANVNNDLFKYCDAIWVSDRHLEKIDPRTIHVILGSHPDLLEMRWEKGIYDYAHMSYLCPRRRAIFDRLHPLKGAPLGWGGARALALAHSRSMVNVHQTEALVGEPLRFALAAAYALPLLSENLIDPWPLEDGRTILMDHYDSLSTQIHEWLKRPDLHDIGHALHKKLCIDWTFRKGVEEGVFSTLQRIQ